MIDPEIVCPQLENLSIDQLGYLREEWEDCEEMVKLIDAELESRPGQCIFCDAELSGKTSYCQRCKMSPGTYHYD